MTAEALAIVLHHSSMKGADKLILVGIANHDGDGGSWPSVQTLAYYANVEPRSVQRSIDKLIQAGEITAERNGGGSAKTADHMRPNLYEVVLKCPPNCDGSKRHVLVCRVCQKPLIGPHKARRLLQHPGCAQVPLEAPADPLTPTSPPDAHVTPPLTPTSPELHPEHNPPRDTAFTYLPNRACASGPYVGQRHTYASPTARYCTWCLEARDLEEDA
jgi:hypothetical protein